MLHAAKVAASETYHRARASSHRHRWGAVRRAARRGPLEATGPGDRRGGSAADPALVGPPAGHRRPPGRARRRLRAGSWPATDRVEMLELAQQATLETRDRKHEPRTLAEQRTVWRTEAIKTLGGLEGGRRHAAPSVGSAEFRCPESPGSAAGCTPTTSRSSTCWESVPPTGSGPPAPPPSSPTAPPRTTSY